MQNKWLSRKSIVTLLDEKNKTAENAHWIIVENRPAAKIRPKPKKEEPIEPKHVERERLILPRS